MVCSRLSDCGDDAFIHVSETHAKRGFDGTVLLEQEISQLSTTKSGFKLMPCITTDGLQRVRMEFRYKYLDSAFVTGNAEG